jgi:hypothetical protein
MLSCRPHGRALGVELMVSVELPPPVIDGGLKLAVRPVGCPPEEMSRERFTVPVNQASGVTVTVYCTDCPGLISHHCGSTASSKSGPHGCTVIVRVGGLGSELPVASITVSETACLPGTSNVTLPGVRWLDVSGVPPGKTHAYSEAPGAASKKTVPPAGMVWSAPGDVIVPEGGVVLKFESWMKRATDGTPALLTRNSM